MGERIGVSLVFPTRVGVHMRECYSNALGCWVMQPIYEPIEPDAESGCSLVFYSREQMATTDRIPYT